MARAFVFRKMCFAMLGPFCNKRVGTEEPYPNTANGLGMKDAIGSGTDLTGSSFQSSGSAVESA